MKNFICPILALSLSPFFSLNYTWAQDTTPLESGQVQIDHYQADHYLDLEKIFETIFKTGVLSNYKISTETRTDDSFSQFYQVLKIETALYDPRLDTTEYSNARYRDDSFQQRWGEFEVRATLSAPGGSGKVDLDQLRFQLYRSLIPRAGVSFGTMAFQYNAGNTPSQNSVSGSNEYLLDIVDIEFDEAIYFAKDNPNFAIVFRGKIHPIQMGAAGGEFIYSGKSELGVGVRLHKKILIEFKDQIGFSLSATEKSWINDMTVGVNWDVNRSLSLYVAGNQRKAYDSGLNENILMAGAQIRFGKKTKSNGIISNQDGQDCVLSLKDLNQQHLNRSLTDIEDACTVLSSREMILSTLWSNVKLINQILDRNPDSDFPAAKMAILVATREDLRPILISHDELLQKIKDIDPSYFNARNPYDKIIYQGSSCNTYVTLDNFMGCVDTYNLILENIQKVLLKIESSAPGVE